MVFPITCPVCKKFTGFYRWKDPAGLVPTTTHPYPLYQRGYPDFIDYISPRCHRCYKKVDNTPGTDIKSAPIAGAIII